MSKKGRSGEMNMKKCKNCHGKGWYVGEDQFGLDYRERDCEDCHGKGELEE